MKTPRRSVLVASTLIWALMLSACSSNATPSSGSPAGSTRDSDCFTPPPSADGRGSGSGDLVRLGTAIAEHIKGAAEAGDAVIVARQGVTVGFTAHGCSHLADLRAAFHSHASQISVFACRFSARTVHALHAKLSAAFRNNLKHDLARFRISQWGPFMLGYEQVYTGMKAELSELHDHLVAELGVSHPSIIVVKYQKSP